LDQEYYYSALFLIDELPKNQLTDSVKSKMLHFFEQEEIQDDFDAHKAILEDATINQYFDSFTDPESKQLIEDLKISMDIYVRYRTGSHADRINYIRKNFRENFKRLGDKEAKVIVKIGGLHASRLVTLGSFDIGTYLNEIACENSNISSNFNFLNRFYKKDGKVKDQLNSENIYFKRNAIFLEQASQEHWGIIDLKSIRSAIENGKLKIKEDGSYHAIRLNIESYDYMILPPMDYPTTPNY
ncbi:MAG: hypothetical protein AAGK97_16505, partial [Bacteroidota bacterium]